MNIYIRCGLFLCNVVDEKTLIEDSKGNVYPRLDEKLILVRLNAGIK